jgi:hypothetical protein
MNGSWHGDGGFFVDTHDGLVNSGIDEPDIFLRGALNSTAFCAYGGRVGNLWPKPLRVQSGT